MSAIVRCKRCGGATLAALANYVDRCPRCNAPYRSNTTRLAGDLLGQLDPVARIGGVLLFMILVLLYCIFLYQAGSPDQTASNDRRFSTQQQETTPFSDGARSLQASPDDNADTTADAIARFTRWMMATWEIEDPVIEVLVEGNELELYVHRELAIPMRGLTCPEGRKVAELLFKKWSVELGRTASGFTMRDSQGVILLRYRYRALGLGGLEYHCGMD